MNIRVILMAALTLTAGVSTAQKSKDKDKDKAATTSSSDNLVPNGGFEDVNIKNLKGYGQLTELALPWTTPNKVSADLFAEGVKSTKASAPANDFGSQSPMTGTAYAGFMAYTKDPKKTRSYIATKLTKKLEKDKLYCVRFNVSLSDLSKFGVNNVGVFLSDRKVSNNDNFALNFTPQVLEKTNKPLTTMDGWETICATYIATGNEEYIIIGGFGPEDKMKLEKVKKPAGVTGTAVNGAYYYIDNIEIIPVEANSQCFCGKAEDREPDLIYSRSVAADVDAKPEDIVKATAVYFAFLGSDISEMFAGDLAEVLGILKANPAMKIELVGHSGTDEVNEAKINARYNEIAMKRAEAVKKYFVDQGINASRITVSSKNDSEPASTMNTPMSKAQNRRVVFVVK